MDINITTNIDAVTQSLSRVEREQIPFALSKSINISAGNIKKAEQRKLDNYFTVRTKWLTKSGAMPIKFSDKRQYPNIYATLTVKDEVAALSVTGGTKRADRSAQMAVPMSNTGGGASTRAILNPARGTLSPSKWPSKITGKGTGIRSKRGARKKPKPFYTKLRNGEQVVAQRRGDGRLPLRVLYKFERAVKIEKRWPLVENAEDNMNIFFEKRFRIELRKALASSKPKRSR